MSTELLLEILKYIGPSIIAFLIAVLKSSYDKRKTFAEATSLLVNSSNDLIDGLQKHREYVEAINAELKEKIACLETKNEELTVRVQCLEDKDVENMQIIAENKETITHLYDLLSKNQEYSAHLLGVIHELSCQIIELGGEPIVTPKSPTEIDNIEVIIEKGE